MNRAAVLSLCAFVLFLCAVGMTAQSVPAPPAKPHKQAAHQDPAERAFQANCSRCHSAPESLSPRITGTVVRHMRVRANLSAEEERLILSYLNP